MRFNIEQLPTSAREIIRVIGLPATLALVERFGGRSIPVPKGSTGARFNEIAEVISEQAARCLSRNFGGTELDVPKCTAAIRAVNHNALRADFDRMTQEQGLSARAAVALLTEIYKYTERYCWRVLAKSDHDGKVVDHEGQMALF